MVVTLPSWVAGLLVQDDVRVERPLAVVFSRARPGGAVSLGMSDALDVFPMSVDDFLYATCRHLAGQGMRAEVALIASQQDPKPFVWDFDNWNGGTSSWAFPFKLPVAVWGLLPESDRKAMATRIERAMTDILGEVRGHQIGQVVIEVEVPKAPKAWRESAQKWATGQGLTNQGRVRSTNIAPFEKDGLLFRSGPEIHLYQALKSAGVTVAPLPVFIRGGAEYRRLEPDFVVIESGQMMVIEVDGDNFHNETPVEAHQRLSVLQREGVSTERVPASACESPEKAAACVQELLTVLRKRSSFR